MKERRGTERKLAVGKKEKSKLIERRILKERESEKVESEKKKVV